MRRCGAIRSLAFAAVTLGLAAAPAAHAATVGVSDECEDTTGGCFVLRFEAAPAEANRVTLDFDGAAVVIADAGAPLAVGAVHKGVECIPRSPNEVRCVEKGSTLGMSAVVALGDRDDVFTASGAPRDPETQGTGVEGQAGDDVLTGGSGRDTLEGGAGADRLAGRGGDDELAEGDPDDAVADDRLEGGAGSDLATFSGDVNTIVEKRARPRAIDLRRGTATSAGEVDRMTSVERVRAGEGRDRIVGTARAEELDGGDGADTVQAGPGADRVVAAGADLVDLGPGNDVLVQEEPGARPRPLACGGGDDRVVDAAPAMRLVGCDRIAAPGSNQRDIEADIRIQPVVRGSQARFAVRGSVGADGPLRLELRDPRSGRRLGRGSVVLRGRSARTLVVRIPRSLARSLRRRGADLRIVASVSGGIPFGGTARVVGS